jgi:hypothetical protein
VQIAVEIAPGHDAFQSGVMPLRPITAALQMRRRGDDADADDRDGERERRRRVARFVQRRWSQTLHASNRKASATNA